MITLKFSRYTEVILTLVGGKDIVMPIVPNCTVTLDEKVIKYIYFPPCEDYELPPATHKPEHQ